MSTTTANYGLLKPDVNNADDADLWGNMLNGDMDGLDGLLNTAVNFVKSSQTSNFSVASPTAGTTTTGDAKKIFRCDATGGAIAATLPAASAAGNGFTVAFKKIDSSANALTLTAAGSDKIDGAATFLLSAQYAWGILVSDGVANWDILSKLTSINYTAPTTQTFTSGSGTYTTPAGVIWIKVRMIGGGGGGGGSGVNAGGTGGTGGATTFGTSLLTANGGIFGASPPNTGAGVGGGAGGAVTVNSPAFSIVSLSGSYGGGTSQNNTGSLFAGPFGAGTIFGSPVATNPYGSAGGSAANNTGCGGQGGGQPALNNSYTGAGGGAGGYIEAIISSPSATYSYAVGAGGTGGAAGGSGFAGGAGGSGFIVVEEHYQ